MEFKEGWKADLIKTTRGGGGNSKVHKEEKGKR
jgi:hypothetical protein